MVDVSFQRIAIVGTGLLGGSVGLALRKRGYEGRLIGVGRQQATLDTALACGCIDEATTDFAAGVSGCDLILLATPVQTLLRQLGELARLNLGEAIITDVGSTKQSIVAEAERVLPRPGRFVGSHPMAGAATHGPESAHADLFVGRQVIVTTTARTDPAALMAVERFWAALGMNVTHLPADEHDRVVARISHLPHAAAVLLVELARRGRELDYAAGGFGDTTRVASGDPVIWADIFFDNAPQMLAAVDDFAALLATFRRCIAEDDRQAMLALLRQAQTARDAWAAGAKPTSPLSPAHNG